MSNRLSRITTKTGDNGTTDNGQGSRVAKNSLQIICLGEIDELNCAIGLIASYCQHPAITELLHNIQQQLFELGADLCVPKHRHLTEHDVKSLEDYIKQLNQDLLPLQEFLLPGGNISAAHCHMARAICRRAERALVSLHQSQPISHIILSYINRLSDLLFIIARTLVNTENTKEVMWKNRHKIPQKDSDN